VYFGIFNIVVLWGLVIWHVLLTHLAKDGQR